jgi:glutaminyl-tRNA synthetase
MTKVKGKDFIRQIIDRDLKEGKNKGIVHTRFPPEPNGYLHIGHAKSICLNFSIASEYGGKCNLRFDDTNPVKEDREYIESIKRDVAWLGFDWENRLYYASDYYDKLFEFAVQLIRMNKAYVCGLSPEQIRKYRGTLTESGINSPFRDRTIEENLKLFTEMKEGKYSEGEFVLRARIDMSSPNLNMRDPVIYRILKKEHHRTGNTWQIYPMYDFTHCISDSLEGVTHSLCTLEFEDHRPLYDWFLNQLQLHHPQQIEFARLNLNYTVMSKRKLLQLVVEKHVEGWDDPRLPTISGLRRRGYTARAIRDFANRIGISKADSMVDIALLEHCLREDLNKNAPRVMAVLNPIKLIITNFPEDKIEQIEALNNPENPDSGNRSIPFSRELYIERNDFMEDPPKKFFRLSPGKEVRLKHAYYITCTDIIKDKSGNITEIQCTYDPATKGGWSDDGRRVKGTLHWVSAKYAKTATVNLYDHLFTVDNPLAGTKDFIANINSDSKTVLSNCMVEPGLSEKNTGDIFQFMRQGYFILDAKDNGKLIFNRSVNLRDSWAKIQKKN